MDADLRQYLIACKDPDAHRVFFEALARRNQQRPEPTSPDRDKSRPQLTDLTPRSESELIDVMLGADESERRRAVNILRQVDLTATARERLLSSYDRAASDVKLAIIACMGRNEDERVAQLLSAAVGQGVDRLLQRGALDALRARAEAGEAVGFAREDVAKLVGTASSYQTIHDALTVLRSTEGGADDVLRVVQARLPGESDEGVREALLSGLDARVAAHTALALRFIGDPSADVRAKVVSITDKGLSTRWDAELYRALEGAALTDSHTDVRRCGLEALLHVATFKQRELTQAGLLTDLRSRVQSAVMAAVDPGERQTLEAILAALPK